MTAIIANRGELPKNLDRTISAIQAAGVTPLVVPDPEGDIRGCGYRRHEGILAAKTDKVFLCDGHMDFEDGYFDALSVALDEHPDDLICTRMQTIDHNWRPTGALYSAARLNSPWRLSADETVPFAGVWRADTAGTPGPVPCVMGACYAFTRASYERWGRPLAILRAWGGDEEVLSLAAWFSGDTVRMIGAVAKHMYAAPRQGGRALTDDAEAIRIWANRDAILRAFPIPPATRRALRDAMYASSAAKGRRKDISDEASRRASDIMHLQRTLKATRSWAWVEQNILNREDVGDEPAAKPAAKAPKPPASASKPAPPPATTPKRAARPRANYGASEDRRTCHACGSSASTVNSTRQTGRVIIRYRRCDNCGRNRVTREIITTV